MYLCLEKLHVTCEDPILEAVCFQEENVIPKDMFEEKNSTVGWYICGTFITPAKQASLRVPSLL
jgi:hypothetical protein